MPLVSLTKGSKLLDASDLIALSKQRLNMGQISLGFQVLGQAIQIVECHFCASANERNERLGSPNLSRLANAQKAHSRNGTEHSTKIENKNTAIKITPAWQISFTGSYLWS